VCRKYAVAYCRKTAKEFAQGYDTASQLNESQADRNINRFIIVFLKRRAAARYRALASIIPGRERPEENTICYKISLVQLITNLNIILYLSICHTLYISVLILINTLMYELKENGNVFTSTFVGTGPSSYKKRIYRAAVSQTLRNTGLLHWRKFF